MVHKAKAKKAVSETEISLFMEGYNYGVTHGEHSVSFLPSNPFRFAGEEEGIKEYKKRLEKAEKVKKVSDKEKIKYLRGLVKKIKKVY